MPCSPRDAGAIMPQLIYEIEIGLNLTGMLRRAAPTLLVLLALTALWVLFFWRLWTPSPNDRVIFAQDGDFTLHYYAPISYQMERWLQKGELALWEPYTRGGLPHIANIQNSTFYLPRYLVALALGRGSWPIEVFQWESALHVWLTSVLMYAYLRVVFKRLSLAFVGAVLWAYSGYITGYPILQINIMETAAWLPLALLGIYAAMTTANLRWLWGATMTAVAVALMLLAGHPQVAMYCIYLTAFYGLFVGRMNGRGWITSIARIVLTCGFGGALAAVQLLPTAEFLRLSYRVVDQTFADKALGFTVSGLNGLIWPSGDQAWSPLYLGAAGLLLAVMSIWNTQRERIFWYGALIISLLYALGGETILYDVFYVFVPGISLFRNQERIVIVAIFALVMLAVYGLQALLDDTGTTRKAWLTRLASGYAVLLVVIFGIALVAAQLGLSVDPARVDIFGFTAIIAAGFALLIGFAHLTERTAFLTLLVVLVVIDLFTVGTRSPNYLSDQPENRITLDPLLQPYSVPADQIAWRVDGAAGLQGSGDYFRVPDIYGVGPLALESIERLYALPVDKLWEIFSVRYVMTSDEPPADVPLELLAYGRNRTGEEYKLFELQNPRPLAHLVYDYRESLGSAAFAREIMADARVNLREMAVTLFPLAFQPMVERPEISRVDDFRFVTPEQIEMTVSTSVDGLLTVSMTNYPGWHAEINGQPAEIVDTYAGLIGVPISAGENQQVTLRFTADSLNLGALISGLTAVVIVVALIFVEVRTRRDKKL